LQKLLSVWLSLDLRRRVIVVAATVATFAAVLAMANIGARPSYALLYAGLDGQSAGEVVAALDQQGALYEVRGDAIYVEAGRRDALRMTLAADGLPANGGAGYELLDSLTGFGTTSQMFDAAYWRAKEGELARTIATNPHVRAARVHISNQEVRGLRAGTLPKASVTVTTAAGLPPAQAEAIRYLVASAVAGMAPESVSVIDSVNGLIGPGQGTDAQHGGQDRAAELRDNLVRLLEARVGPGKAVVEVFVETETDSETVSERRFDPEGRVAISTETEEKTDSSSDTAAGDVTVASNLPEGDAADSGAGARSEASETRERTNFEVSETTRELVKAPGAIRRLTVAVLVDGAETTAADGTVSTAPRGEEELVLLRELVASAVGFNEERGDVITIRSLVFSPPPVQGEEAAVGILSAAALDIGQIIRMAILGAVALVLGLFVVRPLLLTSRPAPAALPPPVRADNGAPQPLTGVIDEGDFFPGQMSVVSDYGQLKPAGGGFGTLPDLGGDRSGEGGNADRVRRLISERREETLDVLRGWLEDRTADRPRERA
jgi:flagellar M-ring protein FliF